MVKDYYFHVLYNAKGEDTTEGGDIKNVPNMGELRNVIRVLPPLYRYGSIYWAGLS